MSDRPVVVYAAANALQAGMLKNMLEESGIRAWITNDNLANAGGELPLGLPSAPRVVVAESAARRARELAMEFESRLQTERSSGLELSADQEAGNWAWAGEEFWPLCPECGHKRTTVCPYCGTSGVEFPWADEEDPTDAGSPRWLTCPVCDSAYEPDYLARCEWCGHRFHGGIQPPQPVEKKWFRHRFEANPRIIAVLIAMALALLAMGIYFAWLLRG